MPMRIDVQSAFSQLGAPIRQCAHAASDNLFVAVDPQAVDVNVLVIFVQIDLATGDAP